MTLVWQLTMWKQVSGFRFQVSAPPLALKAASLVEKETLHDEVSYEEITKK
jgi:hypothetical protein